MASDIEPSRIQLSPTQKWLLYKLDIIRVRVVVGEQALADCRLLLQDFESFIRSAPRQSTAESATASKLNTISSEEASQLRAKAPASAPDRTRTGGKEASRSYGDCPLAVEVPASVAAASVEDGEDEDEPYTLIHNMPPLTLASPPNPLTEGRMITEPQETHPTSRKNLAPMTVAGGEQYIEDFRDRDGDDDGERNDGGSGDESGANDGNSDEDTENQSAGGGQSDMDGEDNEDRTSIVPCSSRAYGPLEHIPGMEYGSGKFRVLPKDRWILPAKVKSFSYSCENKCGYADWACEMVNCDSDLHPQLPPIDLDVSPGVIERGWYHKPCGGMSADYFPGSDERFICPECRNRGDGISSDDNDGADNGNGNGDHGTIRPIEENSSDDTEDEYQPQTIPEEDSDDHEHTGTEYQPPIIRRKDGSHRGGDASGDGGRQHSGKELTKKGSKRSQKVARGQSPDGNQGEAEFVYDKNYMMYKRDEGRTSSEEPIRKRSTVHAKKTTKGKQHVRQRQKNVGPTQSQGKIGYEKAYMLGESDKADEGDSQQNKVWYTKDGEAWIEDENLLCMQLMQEICEAKQIKGEGRFQETCRRMKLAGYNRKWTGVKNAWNRRLRARSNLDERRKKGPVLATSKQDKETKRLNQERRKDKASSQTRKLTKKKEAEQESSLTTVSPKRVRESDDDEEEVVPQKRRRASPYDSDYSPGLQ